MISAGRAPSLRVIPWHLPYDFPNADLQKVFANKIKLVQACIDATEDHFQQFYKCTATFRTHICKKCLRIKLNGFRPV
jgi:hypothetical protein